MEQLNLTRQDIGRRGEELYRQHIRQQVETEANIGKMVIIDIDSGDFEVGDTTGITAAGQLKADTPMADSTEFESVTKLPLPLAA